MCSFRIVTVKNSKKPSPAFGPAGFHSHPRIPLPLRSWAARRFQGSSSLHPTGLQAGLVQIDGGYGRPAGELFVRRQRLRVAGWRTQSDSKSDATRHDGTGDSLLCGLQQAGRTSTVADVFRQVAGDSLGHRLSVQGGRGDPRVPAHP